MKGISSIIVVFLCLFLRSQNGPLGTVTITHQNESIEVLIDKTTPKEIVDLFGKNRISSRIERFNGHTDKPMYTREQNLYYKELGICFTFRSGSIQPKKLAKADSCSLAVVTIFENSSYCLDGICIDTPRDQIVDTLGPGIDFDSARGYLEGYIAVYKADDSTKLKELQRFRSDKHLQELIDKGPKD